MWAYDGPALSRQGHKPGDVTGDGVGAGTCKPTDRHRREDPPSAASADWTRAWMPPPPPSLGDLLDRFASIVGTANALRDPADVAPYLVEPRDRYFGRTPLVLKPGSVGEVAAILALANETRTAIVPQGGNTGVVGGQIPDQSGSQIVLSTVRLNRIREVDPVGGTMTVEAGRHPRRCAGRGRRGRPAVSRCRSPRRDRAGSAATCRPMPAAPAVLAYGNTRELVLGVEVVLASGEIWDGLRKLRKDNTGYDLKDIFIGAEGTLGVITAAVLKLFPKPRGTSVAFVGVKDPAAALALLDIAKGLAGPGLTAFELMPRIGIDVVLRHVPGTRDPLAGRHDWYVLFEISSLPGASRCRDPHRGDLR